MHAHSIATEAAFAVNQLRIDRFGEWRAPSHDEYISELSMAAVTALTQRDLLMALADELDSRARQDHGYGEACAAAATDLRSVEKMSTHALAVTNAIVDAVLSELGHGTDVAHVRAATRRNRHGETCLAP